MASSLYICYFGVNEPLVQTQVLPYLRELLKGGVRMSLLTFEPDTSLNTEPIRAQLAAEGIDWHWLSYHKRLSVIATAWDILRGTFFIRRFIARERPNILHGRVHVPTLMAALARKLSRHKPKLLFDIRGFFPEEYTDAGVWPENGWLYRAAKRVEKWLMREADGFVVLTEKAREILFPESLPSGTDKLGRPVEVIPCCVDFERFSKVTSEVRDSMRTQLRVTDRHVVAYVGSFGGWYLTDKMLEFFAAARERDGSTFVLVLTQRQADDVASMLKAKGFGESDFLVRSVKPNELPRYLSAADLAISFIKACYSKQSSSPTKIAEYLACGLPIVSNRGVGDVDALIENHGVGVLIDNSFTQSEYRKALDVIEQLEIGFEKCSGLAAAEFDLQKVGGERYRNLYHRLLSSSR